MWTLFASVDGPVWIWAVLARWSGNFWRTREEILAVCQATDELLEMDSEQLFRHCWHSIPHDRRPPLAEMTDVNLWLIVHPWAAAGIEHAFIWRPVEVELKLWSQELPSFIDPSGLSLVPAHFLDVWHRPRFVGLPANCEVKVVIQDQFSLPKGPHHLGSTKDVGNPIPRDTEEQGLRQGVKVSPALPGREAWCYRVADETYAPGIVPGGYVLSAQRVSAFNSSSHLSRGNPYEGCLLQEFPAGVLREGEVASGVAVSIDLETFNESVRRQVLLSRKHMAKRRNVTRRPLQHETVSAQMEFLGKLADDGIESRPPDPAGGGLDHPARR